MPRLAKVNVVYRLANVVLVARSVRISRVANVAEIVDLGHSSIWKAVNS